MLKFKLFGRLNIAIAICAMLFYVVLTKLNDIAENSLSFIAPAHQLQLDEYAKQANRLLLSGDDNALQQWQKQIGIKEHTWLSVVKIDLTHLISTDTSTNEIFDGPMLVGRGTDYPIHLDHIRNPLMDIPLGHDHYHLLIQLPQRMRPGTFWSEIYLLTSIGLPIIFSLLLSYLVFRLLLSPLQRLKALSRQYAQGDFKHKIYPSLASRKDEISELAFSFDEMGERLAQSIEQQRQLIQDISHELRTPLTRIQLCLDDEDHQRIINRVRNEMVIMRKLVEETLTLASLDNEHPSNNNDSVELTALIEAIVDDARFEFPQHELVLEPSNEYIISDTNHLALSQSIENVLRNACKYTPKHKKVSVTLSTSKEVVTVCVVDQGPGVDDKHLDNIFKPFFRLEASRALDSGGFGLGLALAKRQITALEGQISAHNHSSGGLVIKISVPHIAPKCKKSKMSSDLVDTH